MAAKRDQHGPGFPARGEESKLQAHLFSEDLSGI